MKTEALTLEVHLSVPVQVDVSQDLVDLAVVELLAHQLLHGLPQLSEADLPVAVIVELSRKHRRRRYIPKKKKKEHLIKLLCVSV